MFLILSRRKSLAVFFATISPLAQRRTYDPADVKTLMLPGVPRYFDLDEL